MVDPTRLRSMLAGCLVLATFSVARAEVDRATGRSGGDASPGSFAQLCEGELPESRTARFFAELDQADEALARRDQEAAQNALGRAFEAAYRGGPDTDIAIKCLGQSAASRWYAAQLELYRQQSAGDPTRSRNLRAGLYVAAADRGAEGVVSLVVKQSARRFASSVRHLEEIAARIEADQRFGAFILPGEEQVAKSCREALGPLREHAAEEHRAALAEEARAFERPATEAELAAANAVADAGNLAEAVTGTPIDTGATKQSLVMELRVSESLQLLRSARSWNLDASAEISSQPSSQRALDRGKRMHAMADDESHGIEVRDGYYAKAEKYFEFGGFDAEAKSVATARARIQPALKAQRERQRHAMDRARKEMAEDAKSVRQAAEDMKKSEAEKRSFEKEADALEAELGF